MTYHNPGMPEPTESAKRIAAAHIAAEVPMDKRMFQSGDEHRRGELTAALQRRGLQEHAHRAGLARALSLAPNGDVEAIADAFVEQHPAWFRPVPQSTSSLLVERFRAGETPGRAGS